MGVPLRTVADDRDVLVLDQFEVAILVVENLHVLSLLFLTVFSLRSVIDAAIRPQQSGRNRPALACSDRNPTDEG